MTRSTKGHLRPLPPSSGQPGNSQCGFTPSQRRLSPAPALPLMPGPWGCMPTSNVHSGGQKTVRRSFPSCPLRAWNPTEQAFPHRQEELEPAPLSARRRKSMAAAQKSVRAEGHPEQAGAQSQRSSRRSATPGSGPGTPESADVSECRLRILMQRSASPFVFSKAVSDSWPCTGIHPLRRSDRRLWAGGRRRAWRVWGVQNWWFRLCRAGSARWEAAPRLPPPGITGALDGGGSCSWCRRLPGG